MDCDTNAAARTSETKSSSTAADVGTADIKLVRLRKGTEQRWNSYIGKEAHYKNNSEVIDYSNTQAPNKILATI